MSETLVDSRSSSELDVDISNQAYLAKPWRTLRRMGETSRVFWSENLQGWVLTSHADVKAAYADTRLSAKRVDGFTRTLPDNGKDICPNFIKYHMLNVNMMDGKDHSRIRRLMMMGFTPKRIKLLAPVIDSIIEDLLDKAELAGEFDFHQVISTRLPTRAIQAMLGVPSEVSDEFFNLADQIARAVDTFPPEADRMRKADAALVRMNELFTPLIEERRQHSTDDVLSDLVSAHDADDRLSHDELLAACHAIVEAGGETTAHMLATGVYEIARRPDLIALVRTGIAESLSVANELLRYPGLVMGMSRLVKEPFDLHGQWVEADSLVYLMNGSANTDPAVFDRPEDIIPARNGSATMSFGPGLHFCIGNYLAKAELSQFFHAAFSRFDIEVIEPDPEFIASWLFHGYKRLQVRFSPRQ